jgi:hypothetical protein
MLEELLSQAKEWCEITEEEVKLNLRRKGVVATGNLEKSIRCYAVPVGEDKMDIIFEMWDYGYFQDEGVKGKNPSGMPNGKGKQKAPFSRFSFGTGSGKGSLFKSLDSWIVNKGIAPRGANGKFMSRAGLKYVIARSIYLQGLEPKNFFTPIWQTRMEELTPLLEQGVVNEIDKQWFERIYKKR